MTTNTPMAVVAYDQSAEPKPQIFTLCALLDAAATDAQARYDARRAGEPLGAQTPILALTQALGGALVTGVHILHGSPGSGKTAFALQTACEAQCPALFVTCEMSPIELLRRIAARATGTYLSRFKTGEFDPIEAQKLFTRAAQSAPLLTILDATTAPLPPADLLRMARALRGKHGDKHFLICLDSVHSWVAGWRVAADEYDALNAGLDAIRQTAQILGAPCLCIAERNRMSMKAGGQSASAGTRRFEYGAESVIELNRDEDLKANAHGNVPVEIRVSKNRHGETRRLEAIWNGPCQQFRPT